MTLSALLGKLSMSGRLLIVFALVLMLYFVGMNIMHTQVPRVVNAHAYQLACGGANIPSCG